MRKFVLLCAAVFVSSSLLAAAPITSDENEIREFERAVGVAYLHADAEALAGLLADDFVFTDGQAEVHDKNAEVAAVRLKAVRYTVFESSEMTVHRQAVVTGTTLIVWASGREWMSDKVRFTDVLVRTDGRWRLLARHFSRFPKTKEP